MRAILLFDLLVFFLCVSALAARSSDPFDQSMSAARQWQIAQMKKLGPFLNSSDAYAVVPTQIPSQTLMAAQKGIGTDMTSFTPDSTAGIHVHLLNDGRYILYGDFFHTGTRYALIELPLALETDPYWNGTRVAFAHLVDGNWKIQGLWNINTCWSDPKIKPDLDADHYPVRPSASPFKLIDFDHDGVPEVVMAGEVWRNYQFYYLFKYSRITDSLNMCASAMGEPRPESNNLIRLYFNSGHRSIFEEWKFAEFDGDTLKEIATWHDGEPYREGDDEGLRAWVPAPDGKIELFRIDEGIDTYTIKEDGENHEATVAFSQKTPLPDPMMKELLEKQWLFKHLTKLPSKLYPENVGTKPLPDFRSHESVTISGDPALVRLLTKSGS